MASCPGLPSRVDLTRQPRDEGRVPDTNVTNEAPHVEEGEPRSARGPVRERDLLDFKDQLSPTEQHQIAFVRSTFEPGLVDRTVRGAQKWIGSRWIEHCTRNIRHVHGLERLPTWDPNKSYLVVSNHRS